MQTIVDKIVLVQLAFSLVIAIALWPLYDLKASYSALLGGGLCGIGTFMAAKIMFGFKGLTPQQTVLVFFFGEFAKIVFTVIGFYIAIFLFELNIAAFVLTYIIVLVPTWLMPLLIH